MLRAIRGSQGVAWAAGVLTAKFNKKLRQRPTADLFASLASSLLKLHDEVEETSPRWASHREGRHARFSGRHALTALAEADGAAGAHRFYQNVLRCAGLAQCPCAAP